MSSTRTTKSSRLNATKNSSNPSSKITMVVNTSELILKKRKLLKERTEGEGEDRISFLPDTILHHILSLLPTKCAVSTCVLSEKWKYLWTSISDLDFSSKLSYSNTTHVINPTEELKFVNFVKKVLRLHDATCIQKFSLSSSILLEASDVYAWIHFVQNRDVKVVKLKINVDTVLLFPSTFFACESLTIVCFESVVELPPLNCLTRLRMLHLEGIEISSDEAVQEISFSCPVLEKFKLMDCPLTNIKIINILAPALKKLIIQDKCGYYFHCELKIYADNLMSLNLKCDMFPPISLCNSTSSLLSKASIITYYQREVQGEFCLRASKYLEGMSNVKDLILSGQFIKDLSDAGLTKNLCALTNLTRISVCVHLDGFRGRYLTELLRYLPNLEHLLFTDGLGFCVFDEQILTNGTAPRDFLANLKSVELRSFYGTKNELRFAECVLKHATVLEMVNVIFSSTLSKRPRKKMSISERLLRFPRTSVSCNIDISYSHMTST